MPIELPALCLETGWNDWPPARSPTKLSGALPWPSCRGSSRLRRGRWWRSSATARRRRPPMTDAAFARGGVIAVVRLPQADRLRAVAAALAAGGVAAVEITLTTPGALEAIGELVTDDDVQTGGCVIGAGTVLDERAAREVIAAGARFVVSPTLDRGVLRCCRDREVPYVPGALTPTELLEAWRAGALMGKLFPASLVGPRYAREVLAPLPVLRLVPSGCVSPQGAR